MTHQRRGDRGGRLGKDGLKKKVNLPKGARSNGSIGGEGSHQERGRWKKM